MAASPSPVAIAAALATQIVCGEHISAVVTDDGDLHTFGRGDTWQLGHGDEDGQHCRAPTVVSAPQASLRGCVSRVALGADHAMAVDTNGRLFAFGRGSFSQLGLGDTSDRASPTLVEGEGLRGKAVVSVACGWRFTLVACANGEVFSWGAGSAGQLGHPSKLRRRVPTKIEALADVVDVSAGETHAMALDTAGALYVWGSNQHGRLGLGAIEEWGAERTTPTVVSSLPACARISAGNRHSACVSRNGGLYTWGCNADGRLGVGTTLDACTPQRVVLPGKPTVAVVACGVAHTLALSASGRIFAWGSGKSGRLGVDGSGSAGSEHENRVSPAPVFVASDSHTRFVDVAAGSNHNLAIQDTGKVMAWGALISVSNKGQLGLTKTEADAAASDALGAFGDDVGDSDTSVDDDDDGDEDFRGGGGGNGNGALLAPISIGLVKKASTLSMRVKKMPPQLTGSDVLVGGADPHPALQTPAMAAAAAARAAGRGETKPGAFTPRPGVGGGTKRQLAFPTDFAGETDLTHLGAIKVHTPSRASARFEAAQSGGLSSSSSSSGRGIEHAAMDFHPDSAKKTGVRAGQHTPRPGRDNRRGSEGAAHAGVPPPLFPSAASDQGDDRLSAPLHVQVNTPSVAAAKALRNLHGDEFATSQQEEEEDAAVESFAEEGEDGQELAPGALSPSSSGIHPAKLQSALKRTMHNFADHKFATLLRGLTSALGKQHLLAQASALTKWKLTIAVLQIQQRALVHIRDTKKGYDLLGARLIYRAVCKLSQKLLRRGFNALTLAMFMSRATERALGSTADARHDLVVRLRKMKEKDQLMKQRLQ